MRVDDPLQWLALGMALASREVLARVLAELDPHAFAHGRPRHLFAALGIGREEVRKQLEALGVTFTVEQRATDAVLARLAAAGARERHKAQADALRDAARLLSPEEYRRYAAEQLAGLVGATERQIAGKVVAEG